MFVPPSVLALVSNTTTSRLSFTRVWIQNGPFKPGFTNSAALLTNLSPISNACGSNDSLITTGWLPVTT